MDMSVFVVKRQFGPLSALLTYMSAKNKTPQQEEARLKQLVQLAAMRSDSDRAQMYLRSTRSTSNLRRSPGDAQKKLNRDTEFLTREISKLEDYKVKQEVRLQEAYRADDEKKRLKAQKNVEGQAEDVANEINKQNSFMEQQELYFGSSDFIKDMAKVLKSDDQLQKYRGNAFEQYEKRGGLLNSGNDLRTYYKTKNQTKRETLNELEAIIAVATGATDDGRLPYKGGQANTIKGVKVARFQNEQATVKNLAKAVADEYGLLDFKETKPGTIKKMIIDPESATNIEKIKAGTEDYTFTIPETSDEERRRRALKATEPIGERIKELENELAALEKVESADTKLHVHKGSAGTVSADSNAVLALENSTHCVLNIMTPANKSAYIMMGDPDDINAGQIRYDNNTDQLLIDVNGSERARILSDGSFCVGDTAAGARLHVKGSGNGSGASALRVENSDNTELFEIRNDGAVFTGDDGGSPINFTGGSANVHIDSNGRLKTVSSSKKYKQDIKDALWGLAEVLKLRPVTFKYKTQGEDEKDKKYAGFTAEEVHNLGLTDFVDYRNNRPDSINYPNMVALMAKAIQELNAKVAVLEAS